MLIDMNTILFKPVYKIIFLEEDGIYFALAQFELYKGKWCDELFYAEISPDFKVTWQDDWKNPVKFETLSQAQTYIRENYLKHTPHVNGRTYEVGSSR